LSIPIIRINFKKITVSRNYFWRGLPESQKSLITMSVRKWQGLLRLHLTGELWSGYSTFQWLDRFSPNLPYSLCCVFNALKVSGYVYKTKRIDIYLSLFPGGKVLCTKSSSGLVIYCLPWGVKWV